MKEILSFLKRLEEKFTKSPLPLSLMVLIHFVGLMASLSSAALGFLYQSVVFMTLIVLWHNQSKNN